MTSIRILTATFVTAALVGAVQAQAPIQLKQDERIVFLGDSITAAGNLPNGYINVIRKHFDEKAPQLKIDCFGAGVPGNKVSGLQARVDHVLSSKKPSLVVIFVGINDVWLGQNEIFVTGTTPELFESGLKDVIGKCERAGARVVLCTPTVIGELPGGGNKLDPQLDAYANISRNVAKEMKLTLCDLRKTFVDYLATNNGTNATRGILTIDHVHLNPTGNRLVAETMLKSLGQYAVHGKTLRHVLFSFFRLLISACSFTMPLWTLSGIPKRRIRIPPNIA